MTELALLPSEKETVIALGTSIRKPLAVLRYYLDALSRQELPERTRLLPIFVLDGCDHDAAMALRDWCADYKDAVVLDAGAPAAVDFDDTHPDSHQWSDTAMRRVGAHKDRIIAEARARNVDALWFCDADLICDTTTLKSLLAAPGPITSAVYFTRWSARAIETQPVWAAPQVWLAHPYQLHGAGLAEHEFRAKLASRQLLKVAGYGACTLLSRRALDAGCSFAPVAGVPQQGLMAGEDRQFCIRAQMLHLDGYADAWPDIFHIYHPSDIAKAQGYAERLTQRVLHDRPSYVSSLVNVTIQPIEPVPWQGGGFTSIPAQYVRGRLSALGLAPELEEAVLSLSRGESKIVPVHFPVHYEIPFYRGKRRLMRVTLNDTKPMGFAPVLEDDVLRGVHRADYTLEQHDGMLEATHG